MDSSFKYQLFYLKYKKLSSWAIISSLTLVWQLTYYFPQRKNEPFILVRFVIHRFDLFIILKLGFMIISRCFYLLLFINGDFFT